MIRIFEASNSLEAHIVKGLLEQHNIFARVQGEYLQSGAGELPAFGQVGVEVNNDDAVAARQIIERYEQSNVDDQAGAADTTRRGFSQLTLSMAFLVGVATGIMLMVLCFFR